MTIQSFIQDQTLHLVDSYKVLERTPFTSRILSVNVYVQRSRVVVLGTKMPSVEGKTCEEQLYLYLPYINPAVKLYIKASFQGVNHAPSQFYYKSVWSGVGNLHAIWSCDLGVHSLLDPKTI